jgi:hypothetical protein
MKIQRKFTGRARLFSTKPKLAAEVLIRVETLLDFARHSTTRLS